MVIKKTEKSPKTDAKKTGPIEDRKGEDQDRPKTGNCRTGTSLERITLGHIIVYFSFIKYKHSDFHDRLQKCTITISESK